jgi:hypothetical protein
MSHNQHPEQTHQGAELPPARFDFENMSVGFVRNLHEITFNASEAALESSRKGDGGAELARVEEVGAAFEIDLSNLPYRNIDKARELILPLARSEKVEDRYAAACGALGSLLRRECELGTEDLTEQTDLMIKLVNEHDGSPAGEVARMTAFSGLNEGWWSEDVAAMIDRGWEEI